MNQAQFVTKYYPLAVKVTDGTGIFPEILLSQAILESSAKGQPGESSLAKKYNNWFGVSAGPGYKGQTVELIPTGGTKPVKWRVYPGIEDSFKDYVHVLSQKNFAPVRQAKSIEAQAAALESSGYDPDKGYAAQVTAIAKLIKKYIPKIEKGAAIGGGALLTAAALYYLIFKKGK